MLFLIEKGNAEPIANTKKGKAKSAHVIPGAAG